PEAASSLLFRETNGQWQIDPLNSPALARVGLVNGAVWSDITGDGLPELVLACEWGPLKIFRNEHGKLVPWDPPLQTPNSKLQTLRQLTGFWTGVTTGDFDEDGQLDILACNWGLNSQQQASPSHPLTIFYGEIAEPGRTAIVETEWDPIRNQLTPRLQRDSLASALPFPLE